MPRDEGELQLSLVDLLHRANQVVNQKFAGSVGQGGPTPRQLAVLASVAASDGLSQTQISEATGVDRATTAEVVGRLTRSGLIRRRRTRRDARTYAVTLTDEGREVLRTSSEAAAQLEARLLSLLTSDEQGQLSRLLKRLVADSSHKD